MKGFTPLVLGILATLAFSWLGLAYIPDLQIGHLDPQSDEEGTDIYPMPKSGMAERGRRIYVANGCFYCHSEQVRADYAAADMDRPRDAASSPPPKWGDRRSAPRDYIFDRPALLGKMRMGPDLANIGKAAPAEEEAAPAQPSPANPANPVPPGASPPVANASPPPANAAPQQNAKPAAQPSAPPAPAASSPAANASPPPANAAANASPSPANAPQNAKPAAQASASPAPAASPPATNASPAPANATAQKNAKPPAQPPTSPAPAASPAQAAAAPSPAASPSEFPAPYSAAWHHQHLYAPRSLNLDSDMPAYKFLYEKRRVGGEQSAGAINLRGEGAPGEGWEIVPTYDAKCLVAYLMSLNQSHPLNEVKSAAPPAASPAAAKPAAK
jgi:cbb3-type cytochrome oxidase cytochrome c subunit